MTPRAEPSEEGSPDTDRLRLSVGFRGTDLDCFEAARFTSVYESGLSDTFIAMIGFGGDKDTRIKDLLSDVIDEDDQLTQDRITDILDERFTVDGQWKLDGKGLALVLVRPPLITIWTAGRAEGYLRRAGVSIPYVDSEGLSIHAEKLSESEDLIFVERSTSEFLTEPTINEILDSSNSGQEACDILLESTPQEDRVSMMIARCTWNQTDARTRGLP
jgi:hypothetical protein